MKLFRDPIYEYITCRDDELKVIDSPWLQRLRHCSQNGPTRLVYPSLTGTRFEHSLGVMELADQAVRSILDERKCADDEEKDVRCRFLQQCKQDLLAFSGIECDDSDVSESVRTIVRFAALLHDVGHFPLSHTSETAFSRLYWRNAIPKYYPQRACHETVSADFVRHIGVGGDLVDEATARAVVLVLLCPNGAYAELDGRKITIEESVFPVLQSILVGEYDVDRLDYLQRDGHLGGTGFGHVDAARFIDSLRLTEYEGRFRMMPSSKALSTVEALLLERYKENKWVVYHHKGLFYSELVQELGQRMFAEEGFRDRVFVRYDDFGGDAKEYLELVCKTLGSPGEPLPPLNLYAGPPLPDDSCYYRLDPDAFVACAETHFIDDIWFALRCRKPARALRGGEEQRDALEERENQLAPAEADEHDFYVEALVDRKPCGWTLWKDIAEFGEFREACGTELQADQREALAALVGSEDKDRISDASAEWLGRIWRLMRREEFALAAWAITEPHLKKELELMGADRLRPILGVVGDVFGKLEEQRLVARGGKHPKLIEHSALLRELSGLTGEIPFFIYVAGRSENLAAFRADNEAKDVRVGVARGVVRGILACWNDERTKEVRNAWTSTIEGLSEKGGKP